MQGHFYGNSVFLRIDIYRIFYQLFTAIVYIFNKFP